MQVQPINNSNTNFKSLNSNGVKTPRAEALVTRELPRLNDLAKNHDVALLSEYIPFGFGDEAIWVHVTSLDKKSGGFRELFNGLFKNKESEPIYMEDCTSVSALVEMAIEISKNEQRKNVSYKMRLTDPDRKGTIKTYTPEQIERLAERSPSLPKD